MKKVYLIWIALIILLKAEAQQIPLIDHYTINPYLSNPAMAGNNGTNLFALHRSQWTDIEGAPETFIITLDGMVPSKRVGLGLLIYNDIVNIVGRTGAYGTYSYKLPLGNDHRISFGISLGVEQNRLLFDRLVTEDPMEITLINNIQPSTNFDGNMGINYDFKGLNVGASMFQLFANRNIINDVQNFKDYHYSFIRHFLFTGSYEIEAKKDVLFITPITQVRYAPKIQPQIDVAAILNFKKLVWAGVGYRQQFGMTYQFGALLAEKLNIGYSYGRSMGPVNRLSANSHEVLLGLKLAGLSGNSGSGDRDKDGITDLNDMEPETPHWKHIKSDKPFLDASECIVDHRGVAKDSDFDGVPDCVDKEIHSPIGAEVDQDGVALDSDGDGVADINDREPNTPEGCAVDAFGIALDGDKDGVADCFDKQLNTPFGAPVDSDGVALDTDGDGIIDLYDFEVNTPEGMIVDKYGIGIKYPNKPASELDTDGDGVPDHLDLEPDSPKGAKVDELGRALGGEGDPVRNKIDLKDMVDYDPDWDYFVVVGVFKYWENVKNYQKHLAKHYTEQTKLLITEQNFYYVWTKQVFTRDEAITEVERLKAKNIEEYIVGNPWLWKEPKK